MLEPFWDVFTLKPAEPVRAQQTWVFREFIKNSYRLDGGEDAPLDSLILLSPHSHRSHFQDEEIVHCASSSTP